MGRVLMGKVEFLVGISVSRTPSDEHDKNFKPKQILENVVDLVGSDLI